MPLLFSYGTLQDEEVQRSLFGRRPLSWPDELVYYERRPLRIDDPRFAPEGGATYEIVAFTGKESSRVVGTVLELSDLELTSADAYEPAPYVRVDALLCSGRRAWVYADGRSVPG
jgi:hypothetical protein